MSHLLIFDSLACMHVQKDKCSELGSHIEQCIFLGYPNKYKGWRFYNPLTKRVIICEHVVFDERYLPEVNDWNATLLCTILYLLTRSQTPHLLLIMITAGIIAISQPKSVTLSHDRLMRRRGKGYKVGLEHPASLSRGTREKGGGEMGMEVEMLISKYCHLQDCMSCADYGYQ